MSALSLDPPTEFDPVLYVADMRRIGAKLIPRISVDIDSSERRGSFAITAEDGGGVPGDVMAVGAQHEAAISRRPDWQEAVYRVLIAADDGHQAADPVYAAIEAHRNAYAAWEALREEATMDRCDPANTSLAYADRLLAELAGTVPRSIKGLSAYVGYLSTYMEVDDDPDAARQAFPSVAAACQHMLPRGTAI